MHADPLSTSTDFAANRAQGRVAFDVTAIDGVTRRRTLHESGSLRVRFPAPEARGLDAVLINTAGGVAGGDHFGIDIVLAEGARLTVTTAAAEKIYRSHGPHATLDVTLRVGAKAHLAWLPQETILFDRSRCNRRIAIDLDATASLALCEIVIFGRAAMGERMASGAFTDRWRVRRDGRLVFADMLKLDGDLAARLSRKAVADGGLAIGTILLAPADESLAVKMREAEVSGEVGVSAWNGFALARFCAQDAALLRADVNSVLRAVGVALPRIWHS